jgi:TPP-dependent trihydroxycyclohexane-1,2-dione (THcHDO) dehydratase
MFDRRPFVAGLLADRGDLLVVTGLGSSTYDVAACGDHPLTFYLWSAMGTTAMVGLGLALARPDRRVAVITGDGDTLMGLGSLATIGVKQPDNLSIVVLASVAAMRELLHTGQGPIFIHAQVEADDQKRIMPSRDGYAISRRFMQASGKPA